MLNAAIRPVLTRWHAELLGWEAVRPPDRSIPEHERAWSRSDELRAELEQLRGLLLEYAGLLAQVCDAPALIDTSEQILAAWRELEGPSQ
jgi:hypothetical protein